MSPNSNHLSSYQHGSEHEALNLGGGLGGDDYGSAVGVGVSVGIGQSHDDDMQSRDRRLFSSVLDKCRALSIVAVMIALSVSVGWFASDVFSYGGRHRGHNNQVYGDSTEPEQTHQDENVEYTDGHHDGINDRIPNLIWSDEFDGDTVDSTKWTFVNGNGCDVGLCGWGNNELQWYTPSNAHVSQGKLVMTASKFVTGSSASYTSSKIISRGKADFGVPKASSIDGEENSSDNALEMSHRFESKMKLPWGQGIWPAFWMLPTYSSYGGWPKSGEIDIMENIGKEGPNTVHGTVHYGLEWPQHQYSESGITLSPSRSSSPSYTNPIGNLNDTFHTYAVERLPGIIRWYVDDIEFSSTKKEDMMPYHWPFDEDFYFVLNLAVGGNWPGYPNEGSFDGDVTIFPERFEIDYVRVYEDAFPRIAGNSVVDCSERDVVYEIENLETRDTTFTWIVPQNATLKEGQGTSRIVVDFDSSMTGSNGMIDNEVIHVQANHIENHRNPTSIGLSKLKENGIGMRVKITDYDGKCSSANKLSSGFREFNFDCGRPLTCTKHVLHKTTDDFTCGERIEWLINESGMDENEACKEIGYKEFHGHCGPCNPLV